MQALKGVVILMTLTIAVLMTLIVYGMYQKSQNPDFKFFDLGGESASAPVQDTQINVPTTPVAPLRTVQPRAFGTVTLDLPAGSTIRSATADTARLTLVVRTPAGDEAWVVDLATGAVLGRVRAYGAAP